MNAETVMILEEIAEAIDVSTAAGETQSANFLLESFTKLRGLLAREDRGWTKLFGDDESSHFGLTLSDLKEWGHKIEESVPGAPWIGRGFRLRANFIHKDGIQYNGLNKNTQGVRNFQDIVDRPSNQREFFGPGAHRRREHLLYTKGIALWVGNESTREIESIPLRQITDQFVDPEGMGRVWAYLREWTKRNPRTGKSVDYKRWYFTDEYVKNRVPYIASPDGQKVPVDQGSVIFDMHANRVDGLAYGTPDALAAFIWNGIVRDAYMDGRTMTAALAKFAMKATANSKKGAENAALQYASAESAGELAVVGGANDLVPLTSAGKGYDFEALRPLLAVVASALDVSTVALSSDSAGEGSYASAVTLDLPTRLAMMARRDEHIEMDRRVLTWMGARDFTVGYKPYDAGEEAYRIIQGFMLGYQNNLYSEKEARAFVDGVLGLAPGKPPEGEARPFGDLSNGGSLANQVASPTQGKSNGTGGQRGGNASSDLRSDTVSK